MTNDQLHRDLIELFPCDELAIDPTGVLGRQLFDHIVQEQSLTGLPIFDESVEEPVVVVPEQLPVLESWNRRLFAGVVVLLVAFVGLWVVAVFAPDRSGTDLEAAATAPTVSSRPTTTVESPSGPTASRQGGRVDFPFEDFEGRTQYFADLPEGPVVIHFFASWAPASFQQFDIYETVHQEMAGEVTILGLATSDRSIEALALVEESGVTYQVGLDRDGEILSAFFEVEALPATVVINGSDMESHVGAFNLDELTELIRDIS